MKNTSSRFAFWRITYIVQIIFTIHVSISLPEAFYLFLLCQLQHLYEYMLYGNGKDEKQQKTLTCKKR